MDTENLQLAAGLQGVQLRSQVDVLIKSLSQLVLARAGVLFRWSLAQFGTRQLLHQRLAKKCNRKHFQKLDKSIQHLG